MAGETAGHRTVNGSASEISFSLKHKEPDLIPDEDPPDVTSSKIRAEIRTLVGGMGKKLAEK